MARKGGMADGQVPARTQWVDGGRERGGRSKVGGVGRGKPRSSKERRPDSSGKAAGPKIRVELMERPLLPKLARSAPPDSEPHAIRATRVRLARFRNARDSRRPIRRAKKSVHPLRPHRNSRESPSFQTLYRNALPGETGGTTDGGPTDGRTSPRHQWRLDRRTH